MALLAAACGGQSATPTPAPTPVPTPIPTPSPTPVDVGAVVLKTIQATGYSAEFQLQGTGTFGGQALTSTGTWDTAGGDSHTTMKFVMGTDTWTTDSIEVGGKSWDSSAGGPYIPSANARCTSINDALRLATGLTDQGIVTKNGQSLHHLTITGGVDASCTVATSISVSGMTIQLDLYATDAGKIAAMDETDTWTQLSGGSTFNATISSEATPTGAAAGAITAPTDPWTLYENTESNYRVAVPAGWSEELLQGRPTLHDAGNDHIVQLIVSQVPAGTTFDEYSKANRAGINNLKSLKVNASESADLGGQTGGLLEFHYVLGTKTLHALDVFTVYSGDSYDVFWLSAPGTEKADYEMFSNIVNSFVFTK